MTNYTLDQYIEDLRRITSKAEGEDEILAAVEPLARQVAADRDWFDEKYYTTDPEQGFGVHLVHEEPDHSLAILAVAWLPGRGTPPHDHGTWAVVAGVEGDELNVRYRRVDDGSREGYARIEEKDRFVAGPGDVVCMKTGGIHLVHNETDSVSVSLHTYGRHINHTNRSQFNQETGEKKDFKLKVE